MHSSDSQKQRAADIGLKAVAELTSRMLASSATLCYAQRHPATANRLSIMFICTSGSRLQSHQTHRKRWKHQQQGGLQQTVVTLTATTNHTSALQCTAT